MIDPKSLIGRAVQCRCGYEFKIAEADLEHILIEHEIDPAQIHTKTFIMPCSRPGGCDNIVRFPLQQAA